MAFNRKLLPYTTTEMRRGLNNVIYKTKANCFQVEVETPKYSGEIAMVRVRNPWGDSHEWKGNWSDE